MAFLGYDADLSIGFGGNSLDAWSFSGLNASVEIVPPPYIDVPQQVPQESSVPSFAELNSWLGYESFLNLSSSEINNDKLHETTSQHEL